MNLYGCFLICCMHSNPEWHRRGWDTSIAALSAFTACPTYPRIPYTPAGNQTSRYCHTNSTVCLWVVHVWWSDTCEITLGQVLLHKNCPIKKMHAVCMCVHLYFMCFTESSAADRVRASRLLPVTCVCATTPIFHDPVQPFTTAQPGASAWPQSCPAWTHTQPVYTPTGAPLTHPKRA